MGTRLRVEDKRPRLVQTYLDVGQRVFDTTQCPKCELVYTKGKEDAKHTRYCKAQSCIPFKPTSSPLATFGESKHDVYLASSSQCKRLMEVVNLDLGFVDGKEDEDREGLTRFALVHGKKAVGVLETDSLVREAFPLALDSHVANLELPTEVQFGVRRIWIAPPFRRLGLASKLLDAARMHLGHPAAVPKAQVAFSQPSTAGKQFAVQYLSSPSSPPLLLVYNHL